MSTNMVQQHIDSRAVATVTLNRADKHNAFNAELVQELHQTFHDLQERPDIRALVLTAAGASFSAGADLLSMKKMKDCSLKDNIQDAKQLADMLHVLNHLPFPTIAKVQGAVFGGAVGVLSCCDIVVATSLSHFRLSEVKLGLVPAVISPYLVNAIGQRHARRYFLTAESFDAEAAHRLGLVSEVVSEEQIDRSIDNFIDTLLANGPMALRAAKALIFRVSDATPDQNTRHFTSELIAKLRVSPEGQEGLGAFFEKRSPKWSLRDDNVS